MKILHRVFFIICFSACLCANAYAASVAVVKGDDRSLSVNTAISQSGATILTFGNESVVISEPPLSLAGSQLLAEDVSPSELYLVRDRRPMSQRTGYHTIFSHSGFKLATIKDPEPLATVAHVYLWPVNGSAVVVKEVKQLKARAIPDPAVQNVLKKLSAIQYQQYMTMLAQNMPTRYSCSSGQLTARDAVSKVFKQFGLVTSLGTFTNSCRSGCKSSTGYNVIGVKQGLVRPQDYYLIGAHYDSISGSPCQKAPGANDNASGMAGVMELARVFSQLNTEASLIFVGFGGEELGMLGSEKYVQNLINSGQKSNLKAFVVLDMVSYYKKHRGVIIEGADSTTQQSAALKRLATYGSTYTGLTVETTTYYGDSDHEPFLDEGMAGALLIETDWSDYKHYHTTKDQMIYQNIPYGLEILKLAAALLAQEAKVMSAP
jgi:hypothetical protein